MEKAARIAEVGERLVLLARETRDDVNESYLLAHKALRRLLREGACLESVDDCRLLEVLFALAPREAKTVRCDEEMQASR